MKEVVKHKEQLESLNMSEDEMITVYTFYVVDLVFFVGKRSAKSDIVPLPGYVKCRNKSFQRGKGSDINKIMDPDITTSR